MTLKNTNCAGNDFEVRVFASELVQEKRKYKREIRIGTGLKHW